MSELQSDQPSASDHAERGLYYVASAAAILVGLWEFVEVIRDQKMNELYLALFMSAVGILFLANLRLSEKIAARNSKLLATNNDLVTRVDQLIKRDGTGVKVCRTMKESCEIVSRLVSGMAAPRRVLLCALHSELKAKLQAPPEMGHNLFVEAMKKSINDLECEHKEIYNVFSTERLNQIDTRFKSFQNAHNYEARAYSSTDVPAGLLLLIIGDDNILLATDHPEVVGPDWLLHLKGREYVEFGKLHFDRLWDKAPFKLRPATGRDENEIVRLSEKLRGVR